MKKRWLFSVLLVLIGLISDAKSINENTAKLVGKSFLTTKTNSSVLKDMKDLQLVYKSSPVSTESLVDNEAYFYVFNTNSIGFVIVSGDDNVTPILAYSDEVSFDPNNMSINVAKWLEGYTSQIRLAITNKIKATKVIIDLWQSLINNNGTESTFGFLGVDPLLQTKWDQHPYYNALCPGGSVTGCVATAMAQVMKYYNYPPTGSGFHSYNEDDFGTLSANFGATTYNWNAMPNQIFGPNLEIATLMYQCGVGVDMNYGSTSYAWALSQGSPKINTAEYALKEYFGYKPSLQGAFRDNYVDLEWMDLIKAELNINRPVIYSGSGGGGGHCFVCDGFDNNDFLHFNWGWGGAYNGYFQVNALNPGGVGTGGGTGGYNSQQSAIIGIEPGVVVNQSTNMALYDYVTPNPSAIGVNQGFSISTNVVNNGATKFSGDLTAAIFDDANNFVDYVETKSGLSLQGGSHFINNLVFTTSGIPGMLPGTYHVGVYYKATGGNWVLLSNAGNFTNWVTITVANASSIELYSKISITPGTTLTVGDPVSVTVNVVNKGNSTFIGQYYVGLFNLDGTGAQQIGTIDDSNGLPAGYVYTDPGLPFSTPSVTVAPGTYLLALLHNPNGTGWQLSGSTYFPNPVTVTVISAAIQPDKYEQNDNINQAYNLPLSFSGNNATVNTIGSNLHVISDQDFYKVVLPGGYNYTIKPRIQDAYSTDNGQIYTLDGLFTYSTDGINWSDAFDDVIPGNITIKGGGTLYFHVSPFFPGETGTYLLDMNLSRAAKVATKEELLEELVKVYPNPASQIITIDLNDYPGNISQLCLYNLQGQKFYSSELSPSKKITNIPLINVPEGMYLLQMLTDEGLLTKKIAVVK